MELSMGGAFPDLTIEDRKYTESLKSNRWSLKIPLERINVSRDIYYKTEL